jgi:beta-alanine--pyruvate transaminase
MSTNPDHNLLPDDLSAFWMPTTPNRKFKSDPRIMVKARGMYYTDSAGSELLDAAAGLWCVNAGHYRPHINEAIAAQLEEIDFAHSFNAGHPGAFRFASRLVKHFPDTLNHVFFTNSGSESVDTALKMAIAWHKARGDGSRQRLIGRQRAYHGMGFGGISVGGLVKNRSQFGPLLPGSDHIRHTHDVERNRFSRGLPAHGAERADDLERLVELHGAETIAAVIVEPVTGAGGVIMPPEGYLQRLRDLCDKYGILLIFDEVITGFGRLGACSAAERFGVVPDIMTTAKGITNATIPLGAVFVTAQIYDTFMDPEAAPGIELNHGFTYSGHPVACAAGLATLDIYEQEGLFTRAAGLQDLWCDAALALQGEAFVDDIRCFALIGAIDLEPGSTPGERGDHVGRYCYEHGVWVRNMGDTIALSPPLVITEDEIQRVFDTIRDGIRTLPAGG